MQKALFLYSTIDGQTVKIFQYIEQEMSEYQCEMVDLHGVDQIDLSPYSKVIVGASIRYGRLNKKLYRFIERNRSALCERRVAFFCVNLTARKEALGKDTPEGSVYITTFLRKSPWHPDLIGVFAGALRYPRYGFFDKYCIRFIMSLTSGETDITKEVEYTNWEKVSRFVQSVKAL